MTITTTARTMGVVGHRVEGVALILHDAREGEGGEQAEEHHGHGDVRAADGGAGVLAPRGAGPQAGVGDVVDEYECVGSHRGENILLV